MSDRLLLLAPLRIEALALGRHSGVRLMRSGMGPARARAAAVWAGTLDHEAVAIAGLCAAIEPGLRAGDVICASELRGDGLDPLPVPGHQLLAAALSRHDLRVHVGPLACSARIEGPAARRSRRGQALGLDMESAWLAAAAGGRPLGIARVVIDTDSRHLADPRIAFAAVGALRSLRLVGGALADWAQSLRAVGPDVAPSAAPAEPLGGRAPHEESLRFKRSRELTSR